MQICFTRAAITYFANFECWEDYCITGLINQSNKYVISFAVPSTVSSQFLLFQGRTTTTDQSSHLELSFKSFVHWLPSPPNVVGAYVNVREHCTFIHINQSSNPIIRKYLLAIRLPICDSKSAPEKVGIHRCRHSPRRLDLTWLWPMVSTGQFYLLPFFSRRMPSYLPSWANVQCERRDKNSYLKINYNLFKIRYT